MSDDALQLRRRVQALLPELTIKSLAVNGEGLQNDVVIINDQLVFRLAKNAEKARLLTAELQLLDLIRPHLDVAIPTPVQRHADAMVYPFLAGRPLTRLALAALAPEARADLARQVGRFLYQLHALARSDVAGQLAPTRAPVTRAKWLALRERVVTHVYPLLLVDQIAWVDHLLAAALDDPHFFATEPALIHADLAAYHLLFDPVETRLTGVLDFGMAGLGDAASDVGALLRLYGERFVAALAPVYPGLEALLPRARFYRQSIELEWVLLGLETGENFWFTAHLGDARD